MSFSPFSAGPSMAGYLWQVGIALISILRASGPGKVEIETDDDVVIRRTSGELLASVQAKHSFNAGAISVSSAEFWKTIRVWSSDANKPKAARAKSLVLLTTATVAKGSPLETLQDGTDRTSSKCLMLQNEIDIVATKAGNQDLMPCYQSWLSLNNVQKIDILNRAVVRDSRPCINEMVAELDEVLLNDRGIRPSRVEAFRRDLLGWFAGLVVERVGKSGVVVTKSEVNSFYADLVDLYNPVDLPDTTLGFQHPSLEDEVIANRTYIHQLRLVDAHETVVANAVRFYHLATKQREDWIDGELTSALKLLQFDEDLVNTWRNFQSLEIQSGGTDTEIGVRILRECMKYQGRGLGHQSYTHVNCGSFHMLADLPRIGWHPEYERHLAKNMPNGPPQPPTVKKP